MPRLRIVTLIIGRLDDMFRERRMPLGPLVAGSVSVARSDSLRSFVVSEALQRHSASVITLGLSIMRDKLVTGSLRSRAS